MRLNKLSIIGTAMVVIGGIASFVGEWLADEGMERENEQRMHEIAQEEVMKQLSEQSEGQ